MGGCQNNRQRIELINQQNTRKLQEANKAAAIRFQNKYNPNYTENQAKTKEKIFEKYQTAAASTFGRTLHAINEETTSVFSSHAHLDEEKFVTDPTHPTEENSPSKEELEVM